MTSRAIWRFLAAKELPEARRTAREDGFTYLIYSTKCTGTLLSLQICGIKGKVHSLLFCQTEIALGIPFMAIL